MAQTSWQKLVDYLEVFATAHLQIKGFKSDFEDEMADWMDEEENYPLMWVVPPTNQFETSVGYYTFKVIVLDRLQEGRGNVTSVVSDCHLILNDLFKYYRESNNFEIDFQVGATGDSLNTPAMDELAGAYSFITVEVESIGDCQIPIEPIPIPPVFICDPAEIEINGQFTVLAPSGQTTPLTFVNTEGDNIPLTVIGNGDFEALDITYNVYVNGVFDQTVSLPYGENNTININA